MKNPAHIKISALILTLQLVCSFFIICYADLEEGTHYHMENLIKVENSVTQFFHAHNAAKCHCENHAQHICPIHTYQIPLTVSPFELRTVPQVVLFHCPLEQGPSPGTTPLIYHPPRSV